VRFIISGPWLPAYRRGYVIEHAHPAGWLFRLVVVGQFKGQVVSVPATPINRALVWFFDIHFDQADQLGLVP